MLIFIIKHFLQIVVILILNTISTTGQTLTGKETGHSKEIEKQKYVEEKIAVQFKETERFQSKFYN